MKCQVGMAFAILFVSKLIKSNIVKYKLSHQICQTLYVSQWSHILPQSIQSLFFVTTPLLLFYPTNDRDLKHLLDLAFFRSLQFFFLICFMFPELPRLIDYSEDRNESKSEVKQQTKRTSSISWKNSAKESLIFSFVCLLNNHPSQARKFPFIKNLL